MRPAANRSYCNALKLEPGCQLLLRKVCFPDKLLDMMLLQLQQLAFQAFAGIPQNCELGGFRHRVESCTNRTSDQFGG
jgi:hypothetical protein